MDPGAPTRIVRMVTVLFGANMSLSDNRDNKISRAEEQREIPQAAQVVTKSLDYIMI